MLQTIVLPSDTNFFTHLLYALIDFGATHCLIASGIVERLGLKPITIS